MNQRQQRIADKEAQRREHASLRKAMSPFSYYDQWGLWLTWAQIRRLPVVAPGTIIQGES